MSKIWAFDQIKKKHTLFWEKDFTKKFSESFRGYTRNIIDSEKKKKLRFTKEKLKSHQDARNCYICGRKISLKYKLTRS